MEETQSFVKDWKKEKVSTLTKLIKEYPVVGLLNLEELPSSQFQTIKLGLKNEMKIVTSRKSFITRAFKASGNEDMISMIKGAPAVILTKLNPFKIFNLIKQNKSLSAIKAGQESPKDLIVKKGETPFTPGPIIGELGQLGIKAKIMSGKIHVLKDSIVVKKGEPASGLAATILAKLDVKPIEIGLNVTAMKEDNTIYTPDVLDVDIESMIMTGYAQAKNLVLNTGLLIPALMKELLMKAHFNALILNGVINPEQAIRTEAPTAEKQEEKEEEEEKEVSTEAVAEGLNSLFG